MLTRLAARASRESGLAREASMLDVIKAGIRDFRDDDAPRLAAALAYYTMFSLPPLIIISTLLVGVVWDVEDLQGQVMDHLRDWMGPRAAGQIETIIERADRPGRGGTLMTVLTTVGLLIGATGAFGQLQTALNRAWEVERDPERHGWLSMITKRLLSFGMVLVIAFLLLVFAALSTLLHGAVGAALPDAAGEIGIWILNLVLSTAVITLLVMAIYVVLPDARIAWRDVALGAFGTAVLFVGGHFVLGLYLARTDPGSAFGAAGSLAIVLVWIYYSAMIMLLGAELTQAYAERKGGGIVPDEDAVRIRERPGRARPKRAEDSA